MCLKNVPSDTVHLSFSITINNLTDGLPSDKLQQKPNVRENSAKNILQHTQFNMHFI